MKIRPGICEKLVFRINTEVVNEGFHTGESQPCSPSEHRRKEGLVAIALWTVVQSTLTFGLIAL